MSLYDDLGADGILALAEAWHARCLADPVVEHAFSHQPVHPEHGQRLAAYWAEVLGGPVAFTGAYGDQTGVVRMHSGNGEHEEMDAHALACFVAALDDVDVAAHLREPLRAWFAWSIEEMARYPRSPDDVPDGLETPRWVS